MLRGLDYLCSAGVEPDDRCAEAIRLVVQKRGVDDRWLLENSHPGELHFDLDEGEGTPSAGSPFRALRVLDWYEKGRAE